MTSTHLDDRPSVTLIGATRALARRDLKRAWITPGVTIQSVVFPALLLMVMLAVFGTAIESIDGQPYVQRLAPGMVVSGAAFGSIGAISGVLEDRRRGFYQRLSLAPFTQPGNRGILSLALARSLSEHVRVATSTLILTTIAFGFGFRFSGSAGETVAFFVLATVCGASFGWIGFALAVRGSSVESVVPPVSGLFLVMLFLSYGVVPLESFPGWVQPVVRVAPSSLMMRSLQELAAGAPTATAIGGALAWTALFTLVFGHLTVSGLSATTTGAMAASSATKPMQQTER